jgi:hypothetical protein
MKKYFKILAFPSLIIFLGSCLKDKNFDEGRTGLDVSKAEKIIELAQAFDGAHGRTVGLAYVDQIVNPEFLTVRLAANEPASEDIKVTIDTAGTQAYITAYNTANGLAVEKLPNSFYTVPNGLVITIPKGSREASLKIRTNAIQYNTSTTYALYFSIASVDKPGYVVSGNFNKYFTQVSAKNKYDGVYLLRCRMRAPANDRPTVNVSTSWAWGGEVFLITTGGASNDLFDDWGFGQVIQPIQTAAGVYSGFGSTQPRFTFDPATDKVIGVANTFVNPANGRAFAIDPNPALDSKWDGATGNVYAHFIMTQPGFQPLYIADTLIYQRPR